MRAPPTWTLSHQVVMQGLVSKTLPICRGCLGKGPTMARSRLLGGGNPQVSIQNRPCPTGDQITLIFLIVLIIPLQGFPIYVGRGDGWLCTSFPFHVTPTACLAQLSTLPHTNLLFANLLHNSTSLLFTKFILNPVFI